jgi:hypothetical protein
VVKTEVTMEIPPLSPLTPVQAAFAMFACYDNFCWQTRNSGKSGKTRPTEHDGCFDWPRLDVGRTVQRSSEVSGLVTIWPCEFSDLR